MSEAKHTPGPWVRGDGDPHHILSSLNWDCVAEVNEALPESGDNANLIEAAPELLDALTGLLGKVECGSSLECELCDAARSAIAKAKGHSL